MRLPKFSRRQLAITAITVAPFVVMAGSVLALRIQFKPGKGRLDGGELYLIYIGFFMSLQFGRSLRYPLINPCSRWGILGPRKQPRPKLWRLLLVIVLIAPMFAFYAQMMREHRLQQQAFADKQIAWHTEQEQLNLDRAQDNARTALEYREKEARGEKQQGQMSWGERAKQFEDFAKFWRNEAAANAAQRKTYEPR